MDAGDILGWAWVALMVAFCAREIYLRRQAKRKPQPPAYGVGDYAHQFSGIAPPVLTADQEDEAFLLGMTDRGRGTWKTQVIGLHRIQQRGWVTIDVSLTPAGEKKLRELM